MSKNIPLLKVSQWLDEWEHVIFSDSDLRRKPQPHFFVGSVGAGTLKRLSGIQRRARAQDQPDLGIQRRHDEDRSEEIKRYLVGGYPWSTLSARDRDTRFSNLRMPGWLPTAIVANILTQSDQRNELGVAPSDLVSINELESGVALQIPEGSTEEDWEPSGLPPIEIIDGQHRLWAFEGVTSEDRFELPVVLFNGLSLGWQAYLFWTINITPKRISPSLAFDLYPLLRTQSWLEPQSDEEGPKVYREARAQELTEILWAHPDSPWHRRINMLGDPGTGDVTQAAFIRSLMASYVKRFSGPRVTIGGLFGSEVSVGRVLPWTRAQQGAFLIAAWRSLQQAVEASDARWATALLRARTHRGVLFSGPHSLLATDQGVRGFLQVSNDLLFMNGPDLRLQSWQPVSDKGDTSVESVTAELEAFPTSLPAAYEFLQRLGEAMASFDWRTSSAPDLSERTRLRQASYRGSGGYREIRSQILTQLLESPDNVISTTAGTVKALLGY